MTIGFGAALIAFMAATTALPGAAYAGKECPGHAGSIGNAAGDTIALALETPAGQAACRRP